MRTFWQLSSSHKLSWHFVKINSNWNNEIGLLLYQENFNGTSTCRTSNFFHFRPGILLYSALVLNVSDIAHKEHWLVNFLKQSYWHQSFFFKIPFSMNTIFKLKTIYIWFDCAMESGLQPEKYCCQPFPRCDTEPSNNEKIRVIFSRQAVKKITWSHLLSCERFGELRRRKENNNRNAHWRQKCGSDCIWSEIGLLHKNAGSVNSCHCETSFSQRPTFVSCKTV